MSITKLITVIKGGSGSGNFGHSGRPGKIGGSAGGSAGVEGMMRELQSNKFFKQNPSFDPPDDYELVVHTSRNENIKSIVESGLQLGAKAKHSVGWSPDPDHVWFWRGMQDKVANWEPKKESVVIVAVPVNKINTIPDTRASFYQKGESIPPEWIAGVISKSKLYR